jgi:hypothetical protein
MAFMAGEKVEAAEVARTAAPSEKGGGHTHVCLGNGISSICWLRIIDLTRLQTVNLSMMAKKESKTREISLNWWQELKLNLIKSLKADLDQNKVEESN